MYLLFLFKKVNKRYEKVNIISLLIFFCCAFSLTCKADNPLNDGNQISQNLSYSIGRIFPSFFTSKGTSLYTGIRTHSGILSNFQEYSFWGSHTFQIKNTTHGFGFNAYADKQGSFLVKTRGYLRYLISTPVTDQMNLSLGIDIGIYNYTFRGSKISSAFSSLLPDGNMSLVLSKTGKFKLGIGISNSFDPNSIDENLTIQLPREFNIAYASLININPLTKLYITALGQHSSIRSYINTNFKILTNQGIGVFWGIDTDVQSTLGAVLVLKKVPLEFNIGYNLPLRNQILNSNEYEIHVSYNLSNL